MTERANDNTEPVRVDRSILNKVRKQKETTGISVGKFYDQAAEEKLKKLSKKK